VGFETSKAVVFEGSNIVNRPHTVRVRAHRVEAWTNRSRQTVFATEQQHIPRRERRHIRQPPAETHAGRNAQRQPALAEAGIAFDDGEMAERNVRFPQPVYFLGYNVCETAPPLHANDVIVPLGIVNCILGPQ